MATPKTLTPDEVAWTEADAIALRNFIANTPRFIPRLHSYLPEIKGATMEERAMTGSESKGAQDIIDKIIQMQSDRPRGGVVDRASFLEDSSE